MKLLIVAIVLGLVHLFRPTWPRIRQAVFEEGFRVAFGLSRRLGLDDRLGGLLLVAGLTGLTLALQSWLVSLPFTWPWFAFSLLVLLATWGSRDLDDDVEAYLRAETPEARAHAATVLLHGSGQGAPTSDDVIRGVFFQALVRWFGVLFWFLLAGSAGAVLFRLPHAMQSSPWIRAQAARSHTRLLERVTALLDLPAALLTILALAVVGDFDAVISAWRRALAGDDRSLLALDRSLLPEVGHRTVAAMQAAPDGFDHSYPDARAPVQASMSLVWRALVAWLTVIALLIVAGLVS